MDTILQKNGPKKVAMSQGFSDRVSEGVQKNVE